MSNFFNARRAANFLVYDLKHAKNNFLLSLVICGLMPAILFVFAMVLSFLVHQSPAEVAEPLQFLALFVGMVVAFVNFPTKQYGGLTDKRYGSDWLMLPASTFEKWLSMIVVSFIIFPVCLFSMMLCCDWLISVIFPATYPQAVISTDLFTALQRIGGDSSELDMILPQINLLWEFFLSFGQSVLFFVLGAIFFKQSKFAKSLLVLFGLSSLISIVFMFFFNTTSFSPETLEYLVDESNIHTFISRIINIGHLLNWLFLVMCGAGIYLRIKTLKH